MTIKQIKILFYTLFFIDILLGFFIGLFFSVWAGIITAIILLLLNIIGYIFVLKISHTAMGEKND